MTKNIGLLAVKEEIRSVHHRKLFLTSHPSQRPIVHIQHCRDSEEHHAAGSDERVYGLVAEEAAHFRVGLQPYN